MARSLLFRPRNDVPATRGDCRYGPRPCPHVRCRQHLWRDDGEERPGNRVAMRGEPPTTLAARWLLYPLQESCALDIAERVERGDREYTVQEIAALMGISVSRLHDIRRAALEKLRALGINIVDLEA